MYSHKYFSIVPAIISGVVFCVLASGCAFVSEHVQSAGNYLAQKVGLIEGETSYSREEQLQRSAALITPEQEYYIGRAIAARILMRFKPSPLEEVQKYVEQIGFSLVATNDVASTFGGYHFMVLESDQLNAFAAPGGYVFVTSGFLRELKNEDQLAAIIAHEISHITLRHGLRSIEQTQDYQGLLALGLAAGSLNCAEALSQATVIFSHFVDSMVDTLLTSGYSQQYEFEADARAAIILKTSGYSEPSIVDAIDVIAQHDLGVSGGGWFDTHPAPSDRIEKLNTHGIRSLGDAAGTFAEIRKSRFISVVGKL